MMNAQADPSDSLVFECDFEEPPEKVWRALTEPRLLEAWLTAPAPPQAATQADAQTGARTDTRTDTRADTRADTRTDTRADTQTGAQPDAQPGAQTGAQTGAADEQSATSRPQPGDLEILTAEPHRLLRYRWRDRETRVGNSDDREIRSVVTFELAPGEEGGTHLRLTHGEFESGMVSAEPVMAIARMRPITSARRRARILPRTEGTGRCISQVCWRRAA